MTPAGPVCASSGASRPRVETVQNPVILTIAEIIALSRAYQYPAESSRAAASRPRVEAVQDSVVPTQPMSIDLSFTEQYIAESSRDLTAAFEALQVSAVERVLDLTTTTAINTATVIPCCSSCNGIGHIQSNSLQCPNNRWHHTFVPGQLAVTHNMARHTTTPLPPTDNRGAIDVQCQFCGALIWIHEKNYTSKANNIKFSMCCRLRTVILSPFEPTPPEIAELLVHNTPAGKDFFEKIRQYNSTMGFTSMGVNIDQSVANNIGGAYNLQIHRTICHKIGSVLPTTQAQMDQPKFAQVYIFDLASQVDHRHCNAPELDRVIFEKIQAVLMEVNPFVSLFHSMHQVARDNGGTADMTFCLAESGPADQQRYNTPTVEEVAVLMSDTEHNEARDIILHTQTDYHHKINEYHRNYDALQYVLLFPSGDFGWTINRYTPTGSKISTMDWYANHLMYHPNFMHLLHRFGHLFQQYIVDMYVKIEHSRLRYYVLNQKKMCAELYSGIQDAVHLNDNDMTNLSWQLAVYRVVMEVVDASPTTPRLYFVDGPGGTGKTFFIQCHAQKSLSTRQDCSRGSYQWNCSSAFGCTKFWLLDQIALYLSDSVFFYEKRIITPLPEIFSIILDLTDYREYLRKEFVESFVSRWENVGKLPTRVISPDQDPIIGFLEAVALGPEQLKLNEVMKSGLVPLSVLVSRGRPTFKSRLIYVAMIQAKHKHDLKAWV
ncbi:hypothetical protein PHYBLDRAFT_162151 [Phycomyces blakesleeanus NRRL 1555(-)]|uniref:Helitron helicase-like domain-containing protein n=1 Tax=Phycomyces blakesleeanus (strain ATCC 8743b / DSM 1359 / FGSC 10004 / NBRC 33097 / NRRL 1555) TaxID=763407 RepID=A0A162VC40_PHYB8|nr:hypothetical protein PHYBLDRAFT_162151 [Phycomyces blakesleeanus NRRL 1555(-)]OAD81552.1 hypothetical protein PHYBLDRAFT_162151 [Phycomyces blakesleeanus NRRL 1555(-)]|eukprot:XP_018299592.1 hypothetical protein PHYBLDRAFT_162151 [Phycomyces blakesleeanus NRRL 1555(-)]